MFGCVKPQKFPEMINTIFTAYLPLVKKVFPLLIILLCFKFILSTKISSSVFDLLFNSIGFSICLLRMSSHTWKETFLIFFKRIFYAVLLVISMFLLYIPIHCLTLLIPPLGILVLIISSVYFFFTPYIFWIENKGVFGSIYESFQVVKNQFWFTILFSLGLACLFIPYVVLKIDTMILPFEWSLAAPILEVIYYPLILIIPVCLYENLKSRKCDPHVN